MSRIDYSKWDNIDTDSEPEESSPQPILTRKADPSPVPDISQSTAHVSMTTPGALDSIQAVIVRCDVEKLRFPSWSLTTIPANYAIFSQSVPPVPQLIEVPLVFHRLGTRSAIRADLDNQIVTYMNIDAVSGFAPPEWTSFVGTVIVARKDKKPLLPHHLEGWWGRYCKEQKQFREGTGGEEDPDDWRRVKSPYEV
ncbi:hypothetical protein F4782DRAFT_538221 [Xylaria castorea]|nr:hypothetical protein F4782DRAFT_538221 [Xylaria castorea]